MGVYGVRRSDCASEEARERLTAFLDLARGVDLHQHVVVSGDGDRDLLVRQDVRRSVTVPHVRVHGAHD